MNLCNARLVASIIVAGIICTAVFLRTRDDDLVRRDITTGASTPRPSAAVAQRQTRPDLPQRPAPALDPHSSADPPHLNSPSAPSDEDRLAWARAALSDGDRASKNDAFDILARLAPDEAITFIRDVGNQPQMDDLDAHLVLMGVVALSDAPEILLNSDLERFFDLGDSQIRKAAALMLRERGDESLARRYLAMQTTEISNPDRDERSRALQDVASIGGFAALPQIAKSLEDTDASVRAQALILLATYGSNTDVSAAEMLLSDPDPQVREQAGYATDSLWKKGGLQTVARDQKLATPHPADGASLP